MPRAGSQRIPFLSAATLLALSPGENGAYTQIADAIRQLGDDVGPDLVELWRRMVFSLLVSNCDDHARNHAFLMRRPGVWALSPAYDVNPVPEMDRTHLPQTSISEDRDPPSIVAALRAAPRFGLKPAEALTALRALVKVVTGWRELGRSLRLKASTLSAYASAFENPLMAEARRLG